MYEFKYDGKKYRFHSHKQARVEAFRLTGRIGGVTIYTVTEERPPRKPRLSVIVLLGAAVGGLASVLMSNLGLV